MSNLKAEIKKRLDEKDMSVNALERDASLKKGTVQNIMRGKSKHPRIDILQAIATHLGCSTSDLFGQGNATLMTSTVEEMEKCDMPIVAAKSTEWNAALYIECLQHVQESCLRNNFIADKETILRYTDEIYDYSIKSGTYLIDIRFAEWILDKNIFNPR